MRGDCLTVDKTGEVYFSLVFDKFIFAGDVASLHVVSEVSVIAMCQ